MNGMGYSHKFGENKYFFKDLTHPQFDTLIFWAQQGKWFLAGSFGVMFSIPEEEALMYRDELANPVRNRRSFPGAGGCYSSHLYNSVLPRASL